MAFFAVDPDTAAVGFDDYFANDQSKAVSRNVFLPGLFGTVEWIE